MTPLTQNRFSLSVIVPVYNEEKSIASAITRICSYCNARGYIYEVIVVNDGSTDATARIAEGFGDPVRVISYSPNEGKGFAVNTGFRDARYEWMLMIDADFSTDICELEKLIQYIADYDVIIGSRGLSDSIIEVHQVWYKETLGKVGNFLIRKILGLSIRDTQCGFKLFNKMFKHFLDEQVTRRFSFDFELLYIAKKHDLKIKEVPVRWVNDTSSTVLLFDYARVLYDLLHIRFVHRRLFRIKKKPCY